MKIIGHGNIITCGEDNHFMSDGAILIKGNKIIEVGDTSSIQSRYPEAEFFNANGKLVLPGFINAHMHLYSTFSRGMALSGEPARNFKEILEKLWWKLDKELKSEDEIYYSAMVSMLEGIKCGTTSIIDHHASFGLINGSLDIIERAAKDCGVRSVLCFETSDRWGKNLCSESIEENVRFIKKTRSDRDPLISSTFGLHASLTLSDDTLRRCLEEASILNSGFHVHVAEGIEDVEDSLSKSGKRVVERLYDAGILSEKTLAVHCVHINEREIALLSTTKTNVVYNPESNMNNAVGVPPIIEMDKAGVRMALGTDGYTPSMLESLKVAYILPKLKYEDPRVGNDIVEKMLFRNNAHILGLYFNNPAGIIKEGALADIVVLDYSPPTPLNSINYFYHMIFGIRDSDVDSVLINGEFVFKNREFTKVDYEEVMAKSREVAKRFWGKM